MISTSTRWKSAISDHKQAVDKLKDRNDSVENRSHRQNLRIIEIPEDEENGRPTAMMAEMSKLINKVKTKKT